MFVTGTRADWGKLQPLAHEASDRGFRTSLFVTGMHMLRRYGDTRLEVRQQASGDIYEYVNQSPNDDHDAVLVKTMRGFGDWITEYPADLVVVHGDRVEALAIALVCAMKYVPCAHVEGGEVSGTIDEVYRHCNTKLCRYHFVSSEEAARRVRALGENPDDVFVVGSPELDLHGGEPVVSLAEVRDRYDLPDTEYGIALFHPVTSEIETIRAQAECLFRVLEKSRRYFVVIAPNNDPGCEEIFEVLGALPPERFKVIPSMRFTYFSTLMRHGALIVGNSSLGVREAPFLGVPSLDVGTRQQRRASAASITHSAPEDEARIMAFLDAEWGLRYPRSGSFGLGNAGSRFGEIITRASFWSRPRQKAFHEPG